MTSERKRDKVGVRERGWVEVGVGGRVLEEGGGSGRRVVGGGG